MDSSKCKELINFLFYLQIPGQQAIVLDIYGDKGAAIVIAIKNMWN